MKKVSRNTIKSMLMDNGEVTFTMTPCNNTPDIHNPFNCAEEVTINIGEYYDGLLERMIYNYGSENCSMNLGKKVSLIIL